MFITIRCPRAAAAIHFLAVDFETDPTPSGLTKSDDLGGGR